MQEADDVLVVGRFLGPHGIKGWVKVMSHTEPRENLGQYRPWWVQRGADWQAIEGVRLKAQGKGLIAKLPGIDDPETARTLSGSEIGIKATQRPELPKGEYYWSDLEGLRVETLNGEWLGCVDHLLETGANDVLVVDPKPGSLDDRQRLIPYLPDQVIREIDLASGVMTVDWDSDF